MPHFTTVLFPIWYLEFVKGSMRYNYLWGFTSSYIPHIPIPFDARYFLGFKLYFSRKLCQKLYFKFSGPYRHYAVPPIWHVVEDRAELSCFSFTCCLLNLKCLVILNSLVKVPDKDIMCNNGAWKIGKVSIRLVDQNSKRLNGLFGQSFLNFSYSLKKIYSYISFI